MKIDYEILGAESLKRLNETTLCAGDTQEQHLIKYLKDNKDTAYGKKYGFEEIHTIREYQEKVPLTEYEDYEDYIEKMVKGTRNLLTSENPIYYPISSGSTSTPKYVPVSLVDMMVHYNYVYGAIFGMVR